MSSFIYLKKIISSVILDFVTGVPKEYLGFFKFGFFVYFFITSLISLWLFYNLMVKRDFIKTPSYYKGEISSFYLVLIWFFYILSFIVISHVAIIFAFYFIISLVISIPGLSINLAVPLTFFIIVIGRIFSYVNESLVRYFVGFIVIFVFFASTIGRIFFNLFPFEELLFYLINNFYVFIFFFLFVVLTEFCSRGIFLLKELSLEKDG